MDVAKQRSSVSLVAAGQASPSPLLALQRKKALNKIALNAGAKDPRDEKAIAFANKFTS